MFLHEAQSKALIARHGVHIPDGATVTLPDGATMEARRLGGTVAIKALIHAGERDLAGGVRFAQTPQEAKDCAGELLGQSLVTPQTRSRGEVVESVLVEKALAFEQALFIAIMVDQRRAVPTLMAAAEGGTAFEQKAAEAPAMVQKYPLDADGGHNPAALAAFLEMLGVPSSHADSVLETVEALIRAFMENDATLVEVNPLALMEDGSAVAIDAKIILDDNALFRHPQLADLKAAAQVDETELLAQANEINFVRMGGDIGLVVNGAGLGLATHDMVIEAGGRPANFMDIRTMATAEQIATGIGLLLDRPEVKVLLINVHGGGMTTCDRLSDALSMAVAGRERIAPVIFRVAGQNAAEARDAVRALPIACHISEDMADAIHLAVAEARP